MIPMSVLDLVTVREDGTVAEALDISVRTAQAAERAGYRRYWVAEHHGMDGIAGGATSVVLAHLGNATSTIRIGAGGIMLPNHTPYVISEQFGTLAALFPGRVDLGLGRAPGADGRLAHALRKDIHAASERFPNDVVELRARFQGQAAGGVPSPQAAGADVEMWILGSSLFGAQLAAMLGLPYAFASHFAPAALDDAARVYRERFEPSETLAKPHFMAAINVVAADTDEEAVYLSSSTDQSFVALRSGNPGRLKPPVRDYRAGLPGAARAMLEQVRSVSAVGSPATVRQGIEDFVARTQADELIVSIATYDPEAQIRSLELTMDAMKQPVG
ncbi:MULTISPECIES: LLM class flavin-dependent oxidoreductase [Novosphingobium]|jgi:luciferase family oxidoreductase group 1|uniref:Luciferase-like monooxygenase n=1 Tax=Novosphingobium resinovorum TaxID=158500 RepID=A0A031JZ62_9SPHN|nr:MULTISPECIES: LLM class flavin-dependent oxidoreductase [Novosphingobium]AOR77530.1 alkane 1-monooxygenase [Novosphingobium resinovorum]EZP82255.1 Luciferase-like protein [Novosphingobium resinovorum]GLK45553.1 alkane 1-monooxygenase [Novosphingobium resinovorum]